MNILYAIGQSIESVESVTGNQGDIVESTDPSAHTLATLEV